MMSAVHAAHAFAPALTAARRGTLLFISSIAGQIGSQTDPPYSAAKAAMINFAQCVAKDVAAYNVRANTICPGRILTEMAGAAAAPANRAALERIPIGRLGSTGDIARVVGFVLRPDSDFINGAIIDVNGGFVLA